MARFGLTLFRELAKVGPSSASGALDTPNAPANLAISLLCAKHGSAFRAVLVPIGGGYAIRSLAKIDPTTTTAQSKALIGADAPPEPEQTVSVDLIRWEKEKCPCCGARIAPIRCGRCRRLLCDASRTKRNGRDYFKCVPACGSEGVLESASIEAPAHAAPQAPSPLMLSSPDTAKLSGPTSSRSPLTGQKGSKERGG